MLRQSLKLPYAQHNKRAFQSAKKQQIFFSTTVTTQQDAQFFNVTPQIEAKVCNHVVVVMILVFFLCDIQFVMTITNKLTPCLFLIVLICAPKISDWPKFASTGTAPPEHYQASNSVLSFSQIIQEL